MPRAKIRQDAGHEAQETGERGWESGVRLRRHPFGEDCVAVTRKFEEREIPIAHAVARQHPAPVTAPPQLVFGLHDDAEVGVVQSRDRRLLQLKDVPPLERLGCCTQQP